MHVSHSLIPYSTGRPFTRPAEKGHAGMLATRDQQDESQTVSSSRKNIPAEQVVEGELIEKALSFDALSSERIKRLFFQQRADGEFTIATPRWLDSKDAIDAYIDNAALTGVERPAYENALDVFA